MLATSATTRIGLKRLKYITLILLVGLIAAAAGIWIDMARFARRPASPGGTQRIVVIAPGETFNAVTASLEHNDIIASRWRFKLLARFRGDDKRLKAGEYALTSAMSPVQILESLVSGKVLLHRLMIPEGYTIAQIAAEVGRAELAAAQEFRALAMEPGLAAVLGLEGLSLEGYLFPDTYYFPKNLPVRTIIETMVERFREKFPQQWRDRAQELGLSMNQVVTLASIIEKETGDPSERAIIASVFHNRLKKKMRLESDPTVIYGIENFDGNITRSHLLTATPYNTYRIRGLPPGPIANPGKEAIEAALYPAQTSFLYFVSKKDGTHHFSTTIEEHNRAVRLYQLGSKPPGNPR
ncbi:MAG: endolytic transglycosylase MltG [Desulfobacteraceae bacterium]|nr:MAG: endolytic transglycosylase MltG [Desulfobacteraceae bacterium]